MPSKPNEVKPKTYDKSLNIEEISQKNHIIHNIDKGNKVKPWSTWKGNGDLRVQPNAIEL